MEFHAGRNRVEHKDPKTITALTGTLQAVGGVLALRTLLPLEPGLYRNELDKTTGVVRSIKRVPLKE